MIILYFDFVIKKKTCLYGRVFRTGAASLLKLDLSSRVPLKKENQKVLTSNAGSNFVLFDGSLLISYRKPYDLIAKSQGFLDWRPGQDSNLRPTGSKPATLSN